MLPNIWREEARSDLRQIIRYIANENPAAVRRVKQRIENAVLPVSEHPYMYRMSERVPGLREVIAHPNYIVFYRVTERGLRSLISSMLAGNFPRNKISPSKILQLISFLCCSSTSFW